MMPITSATAPTAIPTASFTGCVSMLSSMGSWWGWAPDMCSSRESRIIARITYIRARSSAGLEYCPPKAGVARSNRVGRAMNTLLVAATSAFLVLAPFPGSAGLRVSMLLLAAVALLSQGRALREALAALPRGFVTAWAAYAALAIASLAWSVDPAYSRGELKSELLYGALAFVVFHFAGSLDARLWRAWWRAALAGTALVAAWFVIQELLP